MERRYKLFALGFGLGCILVYFLVFKDKNFYKTPQTLILDNFAAGILQVDSLSRCEMNCLELQDKDLQDAFKDGEIDYSESEVRQKPYPVYQVEHAKIGIRFFADVSFNDRDSITTILKVWCPEKPCSCR